MFIQKSLTARLIKARHDVAEGAAHASEYRLREMVEVLSVPRSYSWERDANRQIARWISEQLSELGLRTSLEGRYDNIVAMTESAFERPSILIEAHYDSVPGCPGADDNASAVASMLHVAELLVHHNPALPLCFAAFNREEDGLLGGMDFVENFLPGSSLRIELAHVLEMVGYRDPRPGSQTRPPGLPIRRLSDTGDFLLLIANRHSRRDATRILRIARSYLPTFPVMSLKIYFQLERLFPVLRRGDHAIFWEKSIPSLLWTDTSEYRNPHYHQTSDTPGTLDYEYLKQVTQLLFLATVERFDRASGCRHDGLDGLRLF